MVKVRKTIAESLMGIMLLFVVFLVARHGGLDTSQTLAKGEHTETGPVVVIDPGHGGGRLRQRTADYSGFSKAIGLI